MCHAAERSRTRVSELIRRRSRSAVLMSTSSRAAPVSGSMSRWIIELNCFPRRVETHEGLDREVSAGSRSSARGHRRKMRAAVGRREPAVGIERRAAPLHLIALRPKRFDALVERDRAGDLVPNRRGAVEPHVVGAVRLQRAPSPRRTPTIRGAPSRCGAPESPARR